MYNQKTRGGEGLRVDVYEWWALQMWKENSPPTWGLAAHWHSCNLGLPTGLPQLSSDCCFLPLLQQKTCFWWKGCQYQKTKLWGPSILSKLRNSATWRPRASWEQVSVGSWQLWRRGQALGPPGAPPQTPNSPQDWRSGVFIQRYFSCLVKKKRELPSRYLAALPF